MAPFSLVIVIVMAFAFSARALRTFRVPSRTASRLFSLSGGGFPTDDRLKPFFALGVNVARQVSGEIKSLLTPEELDVFISGFKDSIKGKVADETALLQKHGPELNEIINGRSQAISEAQKSGAKAFLDDYLSRNPTAVQTNSGLIYHEKTAGTGRQPTTASKVKVHYHGSLVDGTVFDSSVSRGEPVEFPLSAVIAGWQEGVAMMKEGGKATLIVPPELGYGASGSPPVIPPSATLIFDVELIKIV